MGTPASARDPDLKLTHKSSLMTVSREALEISGGKFALMPDDWLTEDEKSSDVLMQLCPNTRKCRTYRRMPAAELRSEKCPKTQAIGLGECWQDFVGWNQAVLVTQYLGETTPKLRLVRRQVG